jgi:hydroxyacyl-ACP dehydratase HTD2-like protein with hotdog domain
LTSETAPAALVPGAHLPVLVRRPTRVTCFLFAVAWWTPHRVHYDVEWAAQEGYDDVMVPGLLLNEYVVTALTAWTGDPTSLRRLTVRNTAPALAGDTLRVTSEVTGVTEGDGVRTVALSFEMLRQDDRRILVGEARVEVPGPPSGAGG